MVKVGVDRLREAVEARQGFAQRGLFPALGLQRLPLTLKVRQTFPGSPQSRLEFLPINDAVGVGVNQAIHRSLGGVDLLSERQLTFAVPWCRQASFVLLS